MGEYGGTSEEARKRSIDLLLAEDKKWQNAAKGRYNLLSSKETLIELAAQMHAPTQQEAQRVFSEYAADPLAYNRKTREMRATIFKTPEELAEERKRASLELRPAEQPIEKKPKKGLWHRLTGR